MILEEKGEIVKHAGYAGAAGSGSNKANFSISLLDEDRPKSFPCFSLKNMSPVFFMDRFLWVKKTLHTYPRIIQRVARVPRRTGLLGLSLTLGINLGNRRAIRPGSEVSPHSKKPVVAGRFP
jgi:hypothetical protein